MSTPFWKRSNRYDDNPYDRADAFARLYPGHHECPECGEEWDAEGSDEPPVWGVVYAINEDEAEGACCADCASDGKLVSLEFVDGEQEYENARSAACGC